MQLCTMEGISSSGREWSNDLLQPAQEGCPPIHLSLHLVTSPQWPEIIHSGSICTKDIGRCFWSRSSSPISSLPHSLPAYSHPFKTHQYICGANDGNFKLPRKAGQRTQLPLIFYFSFPSLRCRPKCPDKELGNLDCSPASTTSQPWDLDVSHIFESECSQV